MDALDAANYLVTVAQEEGKIVTNLKLQKILYFAQVRNLVLNEKPLFDGNFERWSYGPVMKKVYDSFKNNGSSAISKPADTVEINGNDLFNAKLVTFNPDVIDEDSKINLRFVFDKLVDYDAFDLVNKTHEESIWSDYEDRIKAHDAPEYTNDDIKNYFDKDDNKKVLEEMELV